MGGYPPRLAEAAHYVIARTKPSELGAVRLNKILWFSDMEYYRRHSATVTGLDYYIRKPRGPMAFGIEAALTDLKNSGKISERRVRIIDYDMREFIWLAEPNVSLFDAEQIDILNRAITVICQHSADVVSEATHDALWKEMVNGQHMPVRAGAGSVSAQPHSSKHLEWALSVIGNV